MRANGQIPESAWTRGDYDERACLASGAALLTSRLGIEWIEYTEDGLGRAAWAGFRSADGIQFFLYHLYDSPRKDLTVLGVSVARPGEGVDRAMETLGLTSLALRWLHSDVKLANHSLYRQDDHGRRYLISHFPCRADAVERMQHLAAAVHKQDYMIEPLEPPELQLEFHERAEQPPRVITVSESGRDGATPSKTGQCMGMTAGARNGTIFRRDRAAE